MYYRQGAVRQAEDCYRQALKIWPHYALALFNLGHVCEEQEKLSDAVEYYTAASRNQKNYADAYYNLALVYERMGEPMQAAKHWQAYLAVDSTSPWSRIARLQLNGLMKITRGGGPGGGGEKHGARKRKG